MDVYLISAPKIDNDELNRYLVDIGAEGWESTAKNDAQKLIEVNGRLCYNSFVPKLNKNVNKVREDSNVYIRNLINQEHGSVFEHAMFSFIFRGVSRVLTHELVRHRVGTAISQESMRYVVINEDKLPKLDRKMFDYNCELDDLYEEFFHVYNHLLKGNLTEKEYNKLPFSEKKRRTSLARRIIPQGVETVIGWSANIRTLRHVINLRTSESAEVEIKELFEKVRDIMTKNYPTLMEGIYRITEE